MFWPTSGLITSGPCYLTLEETHCKKKWVAILVTSVLYPCPHDWTMSLAKYSSMTFTNVLQSRIRLCRTLINVMNQVLNLFGF